MSKAVFLIIFYLMSAFSYAKPNERPTANLAKKITKDSINNVDSLAYIKAMDYIDKKIVKAANKGQDVLLLNMDNYVYGVMYDVIEKNLKDRGFKVKWNHVGGIPGTSYTMFLQISW